MYKRQALYESWSIPTAVLLVVPLGVLGAVLAVTSDSAAMVRQGGYWQPMFSVLPRRVLPVLEQAWVAGERSLQKALLREAVQGLECADDDRRLSNFNSPELLQG